MGHAAGAETQVLVEGEDVDVAGVGCEQLADGARRAVGGAQVRARRARHALDLGEDAVAALRADVFEGLLAVGVEGFHAAGAFSRRDRGVRTGTTVPTQGWITLFPEWLVVQCREVIFC